MLRKLAILGISVVLVGCTFTQDGPLLGVAKEPSREKAQERRLQLLENAKQAGIDNVTEDDIGVIITGSTGPFRKFDQASAQDYYQKKYLKAAQANRIDGAAFYSYDEFWDAYSGWTSISPAPVPMFGKTLFWALVPRGQEDEIQFSSGATSFLFVDTDDFVVARTNADGVLYVHEILCPDDKNFYACKALYDADIFDQLTGQELYSHTYQIVPDGVVIDLVTFRPLVNVQGDAAL